MCACSYNCLLCSLFSSACCGGGFAWRRDQGWDVDDAQCPFALQLAGHAVGVGLVGSARPATKVATGITAEAAGAPWVMTLTLGVRVGGIGDEPAPDAVRPHMAG